ncbi:hypothetical protein D9M68_995430 [compost metagenome]
MPAPQPRVMGQCRLEIVRVLLQPEVKRPRIEQGHIRPLPQLWAGRMGAVAHKGQSPGHRHRHRIMRVARQRQVGEFRDIVEID